MSRKYGMRKKGHADQIDKDTAIKIRAAREARKLSRANLAKLISVSASLIQGWEEGKMPVRDIYVPRLSKALAIALSVRVTDDGLNRLASVAKPSTRMIVSAGDMLLGGAVKLLNPEVVEAFDALFAFEFKGDARNRMNLSRGDLGLFRRIEVVEPESGRYLIVPESGKAHWGYSFFSKDYFGTQGSDEFVFEGTKPIKFPLPQIKVLLRQVGEVESWAVRDLLSHPARIQT
jgi:transcriptional regulator with XRE-family HTH domain